MRLRNNPHANEILANSSLVIQNKKDTYFNNKNQVHIEIGTGKGDFIIGMAKKYPDINFIGVEKFGSVLIKALAKLEQENINNVLLLQEDANNLLEYFNPNSFNVIYLNFSDPWPKSRHYKRRLTYQSFLNIYRELLCNNGLVKQKTDNKILFESSIISFNEYGSKIEMISVDLHNSVHVKENVMSEYERKFSQMNNPIYAINVKLKGVK